MKKQLLPVKEIVPGTCVGCEFYMQEVAVCKRSWCKEANCKNIIYILKEITVKKQKTSKKAC